MTGAAEEKRVKKPDPKNPRIVNGDFARTIGDTSQAAGWHYQRQAEVVRDGGPSGVPCIKFHNAEPGRGAQALQAFAVDGRYVAQIGYLASRAIQGCETRPITATDGSCYDVAFYDEDRGMTGEAYIGPWHGTSDWKSESKKLEVPDHAREAMVRIGLCGATGEISYADIKMKGLP